MHVAFPRIFADTDIWYLHLRYMNKNVTAHLALDLFFIYSSELGKKCCKPLAIFFNKEHIKEARM